MNGVAESDVSVAKYLWTMLRTSSNESSTRMTGPHAASRSPLHPPLEWTDASYHLFVVGGVLFCAIDALSRIFSSTRLPSNFVTTADVGFSPEFDSAAQRNAPVSASECMSMTTNVLAGTSDAMDLPRNLVACSVKSCFLTCQLRSVSSDRKQSCMRVQ